MKDQLKLLYEIQKIDTSIDRSQAMQRKYEQQIEEIEAQRAREAEVLTSSQERLQAATKEHAAHETALKGIEDQKKKIEDKLHAIKTNKEYQAALQEIETIKQKIGGKEDEIITAIDAIEAAKEDVKQAEASVSEITARSEEKKEHIEHTLKEYLAYIENEKQRREQIVSQVEADLLQSYQKLKAAHKGVAVALADNEQCMGCSMKIPPQIYNEVVLGEKLIICPHCRRILFVDREEKQQEAQGA